MTFCVNGLRAKKKQRKLLKNHMGSYEIWLALTDEFFKPLLRFGYDSRRLALSRYKRLAIVRYLFLILGQTCGSRAYQVLSQEEHA